MPSKSFYLNVYSKYLDILLKQSSSSDRSYLDHNRYKIPENTERTSHYGFAFHIRAEEFTRELVNGINRFFLYLRYLKIWSDVLSTSCNSKERDTILIDFIDPLAFICLNKPYLLKSQFTYTSTLLLNLSNSQKAMDTAKSESSVRKYNLIADDAHINYKTLKKEGKNWENFDSFLEALDVIDNKEFREKTFNFRNKSHHGIPPEIEFGITSLIRLTESTWKIGGIKPLRVKNIINLLEQQHKACVCAFHSYWKLMGEQLESWK
jgi:hypothetical protein